MLVVGMSPWALADYAPPPANDDYANATVLVLGQGLPTALDGASVEDGEANLAESSGFGKTAWFVWTATTDQRVHLGSPFGSYSIHLFRVDGAGFAGLSFLGASVWYLDGFDFQGSAGTTYALQVGAEDGFTGNANVGLFPIPAPPAHDDLVDAEDVTVGSASTWTYIGGATTETGETTSAGYQFPLAKSIWARWTAPEDTRLHVAPEMGSGAMTTAVFRVDAPGFAGLTPLGVIRFFHTFDVNAHAGETYLFQIGAPSGSTGWGQVVLSELPPFPANDNLIDAMTLVLNEEQTANLAGASLEYGEFNSVPNVYFTLAKTVWYSWTAPVGKRMHVTQNYSAPLGRSSPWGTSVYRVDGAGFAGLTRQASGIGHLDFTAEAGRIYLFQQGLADGGVGSSTIELNELAPPPDNDALADATPLEAGIVASSRLDGATTETEEPGSLVPDFIPFVKTVWYTWTPTQDMRIHVDPVWLMANTSQGAMVAYRVDGAGFSSLTRVAFGMQTYGVDINGIAGQTYAFQLGNIGGSIGTVGLRLDQLPDAPSNDNFEAATELALGAESTSAIAGASVEPGETVNHFSWCRGGWPSLNSYSKSVWYKWTAPSDMRIHMTHGAAGGTVVYTQDAPGMSGLAEQSAVSCASNHDFRATAGTTYYFQQAVLNGFLDPVALRLDELPRQARLQSAGPVAGEVVVTVPAGTSISDAGTAALPDVALPAELTAVTGEVSYTIEGVTPGATIEVTIDLPADSAPTTAFKRIGTTLEPLDAGIVIDGDTITVALTDGGLGDEDGVVNGTIIDPLVPVRLKSRTTTTTSTTTSTTTTTPTTTTTTTTTVPAVRVAVSATRSSFVFGQRSMAKTITTLANGKRASTGQVQIAEGLTVLGSRNVTRTGGSNFVVPATLDVGTHTLTVSYRDTNGNQLASNTLSVTVMAASTQMALSGPASATPGASATFTASVTDRAPARGAGTGFVSFWDGQVLLGTAPLVTVSPTRSTALLTTALAAGSHTITSTYDGDTNHTGSTSRRSIAVR